MKITADAPLRVSNDIHKDDTIIKAAKLNVNIIQQFNQHHFVSFFNKPFVNASNENSKCGITMVPILQRNTHKNYFILNNKF